MRKLLELPLRYLKNQFLNYYNISLLYRVYLRIISSITLISLLSILYQFGDLVMLEVQMNYNTKSIFLYDFLIKLPNSFTVFFIGVGIVSCLGLFALWHPFFLIGYLIFVTTFLMYRFPTFLSYQWDALLIESLILSLLFISPNIKKFKNQVVHVNYLRLLPILLLIIRLFYHSGVVKLASNDPLWKSFSALDTHLYSQPMPHILSATMHYYIIKFNLSAFFVKAMFVLELVVPFGLVVPTFRRFSAILLILFQLCILLSGNFGFFNGLVIALLLIPLLIFNTTSVINYNWLFSNKKRIQWTTKICVIFIIGVAILNSLLVIPQKKYNRIVFSNFFSAIPLFNPYGLFSRITTNQTKFNVRLSHDGQTWVPLHLKYFDSHGYPELIFIQPYLPRIRWQLWFKFIGINMYPKWYLNFINEIGRDPNQLKSIVRSSPQLSTNYSWVELCYQDIIFDLNQSENSYWVPLFGKKCHVFYKNILMPSTPHMNLEIR